MSLENPINIILLAIVGFLIYQIVLPPLPNKKAWKLPNTYSSDIYNWLPSKHPEVLTMSKYTAEELSQFDGRKSNRILLAIMRVGRDGKIDLKKGERTVFDVTSGGSFYGPDGAYGNFAGRDASRGMAKQSFDEEMLTPIDQPLDSLSDLTPSEIDNMRGWHEHFERKYIVCGELIEKS